MKIYLAQLRNEVDLQRIKQLLSADSPSSNSTKPGLALSLFNLDIHSFSNISSKEAKEAYLLYHYLKAEFYVEVSCIGDANTGDNIQTVLKLAYEIALTFIASIPEQKKSYTAYSVGLQDIGLHQRLAIAAPITQNEMILKVAEKNDGCEPGFMGVQEQDILFHLAKRSITEQERIATIRQLLKGYEINDDLMKPAILGLYEKYKQQLPLYIVKFDYQVINDAGMVTPNKKDLQRTSAIQLVAKRSSFFAELAVQMYKYGRTRSFIEINTEAVLEVIGNDIARVFGMQVQEQQLCLSSYSNGFLKFMLKANWLNGANSLHVSGDEGDGKYLTLPLKKSLNGIDAVVDNSIVHLSEYFALFAVQDDRDGIGSRAQNKLRMGNHIIGIDFGKAYQGTHALINNIRFDFSFNHPEYKNYSVFYQSTRSELMRGVIKIARLQGEHIDEFVLDSYGEEFKCEVMELVPYSDQDVFDDYLYHMQNFSKLFSEGDDNHLCCMEIFKAIERAKANAVKAGQLLVSKFKPHLKLEARAIDLMENLEKYWAGSVGTSLRSPDKTVLLEHLRIITQKVIDWGVKLVDEKYFLTAIFANVNEAAAAYNLLKVNEKVEKKLVDASLTIEFNRVDLQELNQFYNEVGIKKLYHPKDHATYLQIMNEQKNTMQEVSLRECLVSLNDYSLRAELIVNDDSYELLITAQAGEKIDPIFQQVLRSDLSYIEMVLNISDDLRVNFLPDRLNDVYKVFLAIHHSYNKQKLINSELEVYNIQIEWIKSLCSYARFSYEYVRNLYQIKIGIKCLSDDQSDRVFEQVLKSAASDASENMHVADIDNGYSFTFVYSDFGAFNQFLYDSIYQKYIQLQQQGIAVPASLVYESQYDETPALKQELNMLLDQFSASKSGSSYPMLNWLYQSATAYVNSFKEGTSSWLRYELKCLQCDNSEMDLVALRDRLLIRKNYVAGRRQPEYVTHVENLDRALAIIDNLLAHPLPSTSNGFQPS